MQRKLKDTKFIYSDEKLSTLDLVAYAFINEIIININGGSTAKIITEKFPEIERFVKDVEELVNSKEYHICLLYTSPSPRDQRGSRMPSSA